MNDQQFHLKGRVAGLLSSLPVDVCAIAESDLLTLCRLWKEKFAREVFRLHRTYVHRGYKWHGFSYGIEQCLSGPVALQTYKLKRGPFIVFDEAESFGFRCKPRIPIKVDFSDLKADLYVTDTQYIWTMVFTHEHPEIGPFFAERAS